MLREQIELFLFKRSAFINRQEALQAFNELKFFLKPMGNPVCVPSENVWWSTSGEERNFAGLPSR